jgi:hypothetical protein
MSFTYDELKGKTVAELRQIAAGVESEAVKGYTQLNKEHLLEALCKALNVDVHARHKAKGAEKGTFKEQIRAAKKARDAALESRDHAAQRAAQDAIRNLKRKMRKLADAKPVA